jgi:hypothetical protein
LQKPVQVLAVRGPPAYFEPFNFAMEPSFGKAKILINDWPMLAGPEAVT